MGSFFALIALALGVWVAWFLWPVGADVAIAAGFVVWLSGLLAIGVVAFAFGPPRGPPGRRFGDPP